MAPKKCEWSDITVEKALLGRPDVIDIGYDCEDSSITLKCEKVPGADVYMWTILYDEEKVTKVLVDGCTDEEYFKEFVNLTDVFHSDSLCVEVLAFAVTLLVKKE